MNIIITINTDNEAFGDDPGVELSRILRGLADDCADGWQGYLDAPRDINGNTVGRVTITD